MFGAASFVTQGDRPGNAGKYNQFAATQGSNNIGIILNYDTNDNLENVDIHIYLDGVLTSMTGLTDFAEASAYIANGF